MAIERFLDLVAPMRQFSGKDHFPARIVDNGDAGRLAARIELDPECLHLRFLHLLLEHEREGIAPQHCRLAR
jgi:hypothetical protein